MSLWQESCPCVSSVSSGCRLTCITTLLVEHNLEQSHKKTNTKEKLEGGEGHVEEEGGSEKGGGTEREESEKEVEEATVDSDTEEEEEGCEEKMITAQVKKLDKKKKKASSSGKTVAKSQGSYKSEPRRRTRVSFGKTKSRRTKRSTNTK